jgi:hypothetical protein
MNPMDTFDDEYSFLASTWKLPPVKTRSIYGSIRLPSISRVDVDRVSQHVRMNINVPGHVHM